ncbi:MAG: hypothetical protein ABJE95_04350 [Byssovorax sp.]
METNDTLMLPSLTAAPPRALADVDAAIRRARAPQRTTGYVLLGGAFFLAAMFAMMGKMIGGLRGAVETFAVLLALLGGPAYLYARATTRRVKRLFCDGLAREGTVNRLFFRGSGTGARDQEGPGQQTAGAWSSLYLYVDVGYADDAGHLALTRVQVQSHARLSEGMEVVVFVDPEPQPLVGVVAPGEVDGSLNLYVGGKDLSAI